VSVSVQSNDRLVEDLERRAALRGRSRLRRARRHGPRVALVRTAGVFHRLTGRALDVRARLFWGEEMTVRLPEPVSSFLFAYGYFEPSLTSYILRELEPGGTFYDVGAHQGYFTRLAALAVGREGAVHSFEPTPSTFGLLEANTRGLSNVKVNQAAVSDATGEAQLVDFGPARSAYNSLFGATSEAVQDLRRAPRRDVVVPAITLDDYVRTGPRPDFVKIDAEGAEFDIVRGMRRILEEDRPKLSLEVGDHVGGAPSRVVLEHLIGSGYLPHELRHGEVAPHVLRDKYEYDNILLIPTP
jgi:FkbM family methyltransferase